LVTSISFFSLDNSELAISYFILSLSISVTILFLEDSRSVILFFKSSKLFERRSRVPANLKRKSSTAKVNSIDFSCDIFIEDEEEIIAIELKSVKPNSGEMRGEKHKVLEGKTALFENYSDKKISFYLGFPFDPTSEETFGGNKYRFMNSIINCKKYFDKDEILLADELWDFLSGSQNTMKELIGIINAIATIDFTNNYDFLNNKDNRCLDKFQEILENWNLFSELKLIENNELIMLKIKGDRNLTRIYNQKILLSGKYNWHRYYTLSQLI
jgi:hypothetical protein